MIRWADLAFVLRSIFGVGHFIDPPVRMVDLEAYGFESVIWLTHIVLTNLACANDTYHEQNNDIDSPLKNILRHCLIQTRSNLARRFQSLVMLRLDFRDYQKSSFLCSQKKSLNQATNPILKMRHW